MPRLIDNLAHPRLLFFSGNLTRRYSSHYYRRNLSSLPEQAPLASETHCSDKKNQNKDHKHNSRWWQDRENRKEIYSALTAFQGLAFLTGAGVFYVTERQEREKRKAELGRSITKDIENVKTQLKFLINELDDFRRRNKLWTTLNLKDVDSYLNLKKINEYEEAFSFSLRMVSRYDTSLVPQVLQIEADFQNERLRRLTEQLLQEKSDLEKTKKNLDTLRFCFVDIYNVLNIVGLATAANTIDRNRHTDEQRLLQQLLRAHKIKSKISINEGLNTEVVMDTEESSIITDEVRDAIHQFRRQQLKNLRDQKCEKMINTTKLVRDEVFNNNKP